MAMTQNQMVLNHLQNIGSMTRAEAYDLYGISELNTRICNLRSDGHLIGSRNKTVTNRYGKRVTVSEYYLIRKREDEGNAENQ